jgi:hypothetical protein
MAMFENPRPDDFPSELKSLEAALAGLAPARNHIDRDRLMYEAGAAAASAVSLAAPRWSRARQLGWPLATAAALLVSVALGAVMLFRAPSERIVYVDRPDASANQTAPTTSMANEPNLPSDAAQTDSINCSYLVLRDQVLRMGAAAMDLPAVGGGAADRTDVRNRALLNQLLGG